MCVCVCVKVTWFHGRLMFLPSARPLPTHWLSDSGRCGQKEPPSYLWMLKYRTLTTHKHTHRDTHIMVSETENTHAQAEVICQHERR